jgi:hypothetical protein
MALYSLAPYERRQYFDDNGDPLAFGTVETFAAGTAAHAVTYSDATGTPNTNPIVLDAAGRCVIYLAAASYKFLIRDQFGVIVGTVDPVASTVLGSAAAVDLTGTAGEALGAGAAVYLSAGDGGKTPGRWYLASSSLTYSSSAAMVIGITTTAIGSGSTGIVRIGGEVTGLAGLIVGGTYYIDTAGALTPTAPLNMRPVGVAETTTTLLLSANPGQSLAANDVNDFRLTLTSGVPITTADVTGTSTVYWTPFTGNRIALFNGSGWDLVRSTELSIGTPGTSGVNYDVFVYNNAGAPALEYVAWNTDTTRSVALARQDGVWSRSGSLTRRYVGTLRATTGDKWEDSMANRLVYNQYHRQPRVLRRNEATDTWTYATATLRQANAAAANQCTVVVGIAEVPLTLTLRATWSHTTIGGFLVVAIGEDSTTVRDTAGQVQTTVTDAANTFKTSSAELVKYPPLGYHIYTWLELASGATATIVGDNAGAAGGPQSGMSGTIEG